MGRVGEGGGEKEKAAVPKAIKLGLRKKVIVGDRCAFRDKTQRWRVDL